MPLAVQQLVEHVASVASCTNALRMLAPHAGLSLCARAQSVVAHGRYCALHLLCTALLAAVCCHELHNMYTECVQAISR